MAKTTINTKSSAYTLDKEAFMKELRQFNESKNITVKPPIVNGIEIDLFLFYSLVQQRGGISKVNQSDVWESFLRPLRLPHPCVNGSTLLRRIYGMHLEKFERAKGPPGRDDDMEMDEDPKRGRSNIPRIMFSGGTYISASGEALRTSNTRPTATHAERLALSLLSPMPNEQDFAVNVCTVLAADHSNRLPLAATPHILDFLLAHGGVYNHSSLRDTIGRSYFEARGRYPDDFWQLRAGGGGARELADEARFQQSGAAEPPDLMVQALAAHRTLTDCLMNESSDEDGSLVEKIRDDFDIVEDWVTEPSDESQLFAPELPGGASCVYTQRVLQIASIVRSLSFHEENVQYLAKNNTLIRFLLLCANSWVGTLRQSGLDTLGNISTELIIKDPATCLLSRHILSTIQSALVSPDRARVLAALELLNKLAQNEANEDALLKALEAKVYQGVCSLLTLRDIMVLVCTLECVYALTALGDKAAENVAKAPGLVHTLVSLVTVEAQSYGPRACILMRVVETVSGPAALAEQQQQQQTTQPQHHQPVSSQPKPVEQVPPGAGSPAPATPAVTPGNALQHSHTQQRTVQENEQFAMAWLRSSMEPLPPADNGAYDASEMYRLYVACCTKLQRKGVIAPAHFPRLVRTVFGGSVGPNAVTTSTGESQQVYIGLRAKNTLNTSRTPAQSAAGPSSPILKAQLTNKPSVVDVKPLAQPQQPPATHPHLSQALESNPTNTTLIKHLLAHKVSPATQTQVAQRQQNQQRIPQNTVVIQQNPQAIELDPEAMIKCTTITPGGIASSSPSIQDKVGLTTEEIMIPKEEPVQIQIDEQSQLTIKTTQNKMLADLLEKKSNPPVQVVQMAPQINAPTIQITETGQIVQVKADPTPVIQINEALMTQGGQFFQIKNEQGQLIQIKNEQGQIIQLKSDQIQPGLIQFKNESVIKEMIQIKNDKEIIEQVITDHSYSSEPPNKKAKIDDKRDTSSPHETASKTAANLYAALAASALEDEEDLMPLPPPKQEPVEMMQPSVIMSAGESGSVIIQEPILQVQQPTLQVQQPTMQVQQQTMQMQQQTIVQQPTLQVQGSIQMQQPMLQVQPMDVQNILASQSGQLILQEKTMATQPTQFVQQPMQIIATPGTSQAGLSYITQNIPSNMMQKTIIIVQGPTGGGPLTLTVNNPGGLDEATLNSLIAQATEAITQQQIIQNTAMLQQAQRVIVSQPTLVSSSQPVIMKTALAQAAPQITPSQQPIITAQPQPHKATIVNQPQQIVVTQKNPPALISTSASSPQIIVSSNQQMMMNSPLKQSVNRVIAPQRTQLQSVQSTDNKPVMVQQQKTQQPLIRQVITRQPVMVGNTKIGEKETVVNQPVIQSVAEAAKPIPIQTPPPAATPGPSATPPPVTPQEDTPWICHWRGCGKSFSCSSGVFGHVARTHCPGGAGAEGACLWAECDRVPRRTFALLNHLADKHCTPQALKALYNSRKNTAAEGDGNKPVSLGYPPNAALAALNKHAADMFNPRELMHRAELSRTPQEQTDENEGPVTKSIRLTAALILRNIVIYSNTGRRQLRSYEAHLSTIAFSSVEASRTIAQVLFDMNNI